MTKGNSVSDSKETGKHSASRNQDQINNWRNPQALQNPSNLPKITSWRVQGDVLENSKSSNNNWGNQQKLQNPSDKPKITNWRVQGDAPDNSKSSNNGRKDEEKDKRIPRISDEDFEIYFQNKRTYTKNPDWRLPEVSRAYSSGCYEFETFEKVRKDIVDVKIGYDIRDKFPGTKWKDISSEFELNNYIKLALKKLKIGHVVKNWPKAYEIFAEYLSVPTGELNSVQIGDADGGVVLALNHFLHSRSFGNIKWNWKAICDNPYYEGNNSSNK